MSKKLIAIKQKNEKFANIVWQVSNLCNYRCDYCNEGNWKGDYKNLNINKVIIGLEKIYDYYLEHDYKLLKIFFSGGEPTYWKPFIDIINHAKQSKFDYVQIAVNTNFSTKKSWWEKNWELFDDVVASYHPEFANDDHFIENYLFSGSQNVPNMVYEIDGKQYKDKYTFFRGARLEEIDGDDKIGLQ